MLRFSVAVDLDATALKFPTQMTPPTKRCATTPLSNNVTGKKRKCQDEVDCILAMQKEEHVQRMKDMTDERQRSVEKHSLEMQILYIELEIAKKKLEAVRDV